MSSENLPGDVRSRASPTAGWLAQQRFRGVFQRRARAPWHESPGPRTECSHHHPRERSECSERDAPRRGPVAEVASRDVSLPRRAEAVVVMLVLPREDAVSPTPTLLTHSERTVLTPDPPGTGCPALGPEAGGGWDLLLRTAQRVTAMPPRLCAPHGSSATWTCRAR